MTLAAARKLALIGYRGAGKSAVGRLVAERLSLPFVDADEELERQAGRSIAEIFAASGEPVFRDLESDVLRQLSQRGACVAALGGGVVLRPENRALLRSWPAVVWLRASVDVLAARIAADPTTAARRPNLTAAGGVEEIARLLAVREPLYHECATIEIDTAGQAEEHLAAQVVQTLAGKEHGRS